MTRHLTLMLCGFSMLTACSEEPKPRTVTEFVENPMLLEAAVIRCAQDRSKSRYVAECVNARQAVARVQAKEEAARKAALEAASENKRRALRRTQAAATEARRRAAEERRAREDAENFGQFGATPSTETGEGDALPEGNVPIAVVPSATDDMNSASTYDESPPASEGGNAPIAEQSPPESDLESVRDELRRRNEQDGD